jgi:serine protease AprX
MQALEEAACAHPANLPPNNRPIEKPLERSMKTVNLKKNVFYFLSLFLLVALVAAPVGAAPVRIGFTDFTGKVSNDVLEETAAGDTASIVVLLEDQADLSAAYAIADEDERGWYVYNTLKAHADTSQAPIQALLEAEGAAYTSFWVANMIVTEGDSELVQALAARPEVKVIESDEPTDWIQDEGGVEEITETGEVDFITPGVNNIQAPQVWNLGYNGQGIVVANQDTGMRWTHAAIREKYRGWGGSIAASDHNYNWWDSIHVQLGGDGGTGSPATNPCGRNLTVPCDDNGHGTHTTGTIVGDGGAGTAASPNQIGVAPGAKWIGCRNMDSGNGRPSTYAECFQFFIAPTDLSGNNADPSKRPHVMNNSWGCPPSELCAANTLKTIVENTLAAGIMVVTSAGNDGPSCSTVQDPPGIYEVAFAVGAINGSTNALTSFSSRGPVSVDGSFRMKPEIVAPGQTVRSSTRTSDTSYGNSSGTSMASPHVVGSVALLWSARPNLVRDIERTKYLLISTANPAVTVPNNAAGCGGITSVPNNHFGYGRINVLAAYNAEPSLYQTITFPSLANQVIGAADFDPGATASSGLPVSYTASGSCSIVNGLVHLDAVGTCTVTASQTGLATYKTPTGITVPYFPAMAVSQAFNVTYNFSGFFQPVDTSLNTANAGQSIPLKWRITDANGNPVTDLQTVAAAAVSLVCPIGVTTDQLEEYASGSSGLQNHGDGYYQFNWSTPRSYARSCKTLTLNLGEGAGSERTADFQFLR